MKPNPTVEVPQLFSLTFIELIILFEVSIQPVMFQKESGGFGGRADSTTVVCFPLTGQVTGPSALVNVDSKPLHV